MIDSYPIIMLCDLELLHLVWSASSIKGGCNYMYKILTLWPFAEIIKCDFAIRVNQSSDGTSKVGRGPTKCEHICK